MASTDMPKNYAGAAWPGRYASYEHFKVFLTGFAVLQDWAFVTH